MIVPGGVSMRLCGKCTIPNILSFSRILISPLTVFFLFEVFGKSFSFFAIPVSSYQIAFIFCVYAGVSDFLDGFIARYFGSASEFGARWDERADKIWSWPILVALWILSIVPWWLLVIIGIRDSLVWWFRQQVGKSGGKPTVSMLGKIKMSLLFIYIAASVFLLEDSLHFGFNIIYLQTIHLIFSVMIAVLVSFSGLHYFWRDRTALAQRIKNG